MTTRIRDREPRSAEEGAPVFADGAGDGLVGSLDEALLGFDGLTKLEARASIGELDYYRQLADKLLSLGRLALALDVLGPPIERAVRATWHGAVLPADVLDRVGCTLVRLAHESLDPFWFDATVVLHLAACRLFQEDTAQHLSWLRSEGSMGDEIFLDAYRKRLRAAAARMPPDDRERCDDVLGLLPPLGAVRH